MKEDSILVIYTGGTIGMEVDPVKGSLVPVDFHDILSKVPELKEYGFKIETIAFDPLIDSSNVSTAFWEKLVSLIEKEYSKHLGFVILHGTDTMAYSASALSFMLDYLEKPVIFTGSQLPLGMIRTDGKENLITAVEIAAATDNDKALVPEVCIYFENRLLRGNRTTKVSAENFNAFRSPNYLPLAEAGVSIKYLRDLILTPTVRQNFIVRKKLETRIALLKLHPSISHEFVESIMGLEGLKGLVLESYGNGNCPTDNWFIDLLRNFNDKGGTILNITQCQSGSVTMGVYETSRKLISAGVVSGYDMTTEAALTKLMYLLANYQDADTVNKLLNKSLRGEITIQQ